MIIEICSQNRALEEVANMRTGEPVSIISIVSSDEKGAPENRFRSFQSYPRMRKTWNSTAMRTSAEFFT